MEINVSDQSLDTKAGSFSGEILSFLVGAGKGWRASAPSILRHPPP